MKFLLNLVSLVLVSQLATSQALFSAKNAVPPSPNVASIFHFTESPVSKFNGVPQIGIPIYTIQGKNIEIPISLSYHAGGVKVTDAASWVGMNWALNAGGAIVQSVNGIRDDAPLRGRFNSTPMNLNSLSNPTTCELKAVIEGYYDSEPDLFTFSFNGKSGQFFLDDNKNPVQTQDQKLKIEYASNNNPPYDIFFSWKITDLDGIQYVFNDIESLLSFSRIVRDGFLIGVGEIGYHPNVTQNTWMLSEIILTNGETIKFNYEAQNSIDCIFASESFEAALEPANGQTTYPIVTQPVIKNFLKQQLIQGRRLKSIDFPGGKIEFIPGSDRCDVWNDKFLDKIVVYNFYNQKVKEFKLDYKYLVGRNAYDPAQIDCSTDDVPDAEMSSSNYQNNFKGRRLFLFAVHELDENGTSGGTYNLEYNHDIGLPDRFSAQQDFWGFFNGNGFNTLFQSIFPSGEKLDGIDRFNIFGRDPNLIYAQQGTLKKITYPTGGYTEFDYELNSLVTSAGSTRPVIHPEQVYNTSGTNSGQQLDILTINNASGSVLLHFAVDACTFGPTSNNLVGFSITDMNGNSVISGQDVEDDLQTATYGEISYSLNNGTYKIFSYAHAPFPCSYNIKIEQWKEDQPLSVGNYNVGGLRIKKIKNFDPIAGKATTKIYDYNKLIDGHLLSSGVTSIPYTSIRNDFVFWKSSKLEYRNTGFGGNWPTDEIMVKYLSMTSGTNYTLGSNQDGSIGYLHVKEQNIDGSNINEGYTIYEYEQYGDYISPWSPIFEGIGGYDVSGADKYPWAPKLRSTWLQGRPSKISIFRKVGENDYKAIKSTRYSYSPIVVKDVTNAYVAAYVAASALPYGSSCPNTGILLSVHEAFRYTKYSLFSSYSLLDSLITEEIDASNNKTVTTVIYNYNMQNLLPSQITTSNSLKGASIEVIKYPTDYSSISATDAISAGIKALQNAYALDRPVEKSVQRVVNNVNIGTVSAIFNSYKADNLQSDKIFAAEIISPVTSFNSSTVSAGAVIKDFRYKERISFNQYDAKANILEQQKVNDVKEVYLWGYNGQYPVAKILNSTNSVASGYITQSVLDDPSDDATLRSHLANLRNIPGTMVATYTYKPLVGMTSQTDPAGRTIYYEYDSFNRLKTIRDQDGKVIKTIDYQYQQTNNQ